LQKLTIIPTIISSLRIAALPIFIFFNSTSNIIACLILLVFSAATDFFDGYIARKLAATSRFGAYYDATTDFTLVVGIYIFFTIKGLYPFWLPLLITASFVQFIATSQFSRKIYDPIGKYIGSALYIGIVLTLVFPAQATYSFVQYAFVGFFVISIGSRIISLTRNRNS
jgi:phosphatidylglycerophosphate synthase